MGGRFSHQLVAPNDLLVYNTYGFNRGVQICRDLARVDVLLGLLIVRVCGSRSLIDSYQDGAAGLFLTETALWSTGPPGKPVLYKACGTRWRTRGAIDDYIPKHGNREIQYCLVLTAGTSSWVSLWSLVTVSTMWCLGCTLGGVTNFASDTKVEHPYKYDIPRAIWNPPLTRRGSPQPKCSARIGVSKSDTPQSTRLAYNNIPVLANHVFGQ
ncbi:hypothetical protein FXO38_03240 [Capsicum annuum]|nr:hypothetical protein FXO38_03240 [Capsicum annuum]